MRLFFSGNEELARHYAPIVTTISNNFAQLCKLRGLAQNASHFSLGEYGVAVSIHYSFGQLQAQIHAPFSVQEEGVVTETLKFKSAIWIRTFDEAVRFSYNGMFFSYDAYIEPVYDPPKLIITGVESYIPDEGAIIVAAEEYRDTINFSNFTEPFGISSTFANCSYMKNFYGSIDRVVGASIVVDGNFQGYKQSAFFCPDGRTLNCVCGGDSVFRDEFSETRESTDLGDECYVFAWGVRQEGSILGYVYKFLLGPDYGTVRSTVKAMLDGNRNMDAELATCQFFGTSGPPSAVMRRVEFPSKYTAIYLSGDGNAVITKEGPQYLWGASSSSEYIEYQMWVRIKAVGSASMIVKMLDIDGTVVTEDIDPKIFWFSDIVNVSNFSCDGQDGKPGVMWVTIDYSGYVAPDFVRGAPRGYIEYVTRGKPVAAAYVKELGWKKCISINNSLTDTCLWWSTYSEWVLVANWLYFQRSNISLRKREPDAYGIGYYIYNEKINLIPNPSGKFAIFLSEYALYVSLYNFAGNPNGIYRVEGSSLTLVLEFAPGEMEPVFMDEKSGVLCTKKAILLDHGARVIQCNECCGMFLDFTHYVDKLESGAFVINKIPEGDDPPVTVDTLPAGAYNFYELSEDASVCVISNYWQYHNDPQSSAPAIVVDFSDPVYRFEPSDQTILQYMDPFIFNADNGSAVVGYQSIIPYGARYVSICECSPESADGRKHYIYNAYANPTGYNARCSGLSDSTSGPCPIQPGSKVNNFHKFPTIVPQYSNATANRRDQRYDGKRLNRYIYHHTGKILRRISEDLEPINTEFEISTTRSV